MSTKQFKTLRVAGALILAGLVSGQVMAQADATATAAVNATVLTPIAISKTADLQFGSFAVDATSDGTVVIAAADGERSFTGGAASVSTSTTGFSSASFTVTGETTATFSVALPASATLTKSGGGSLTVDTFTVDIGGERAVVSNGTTGTLVDGSATMYIGATLSVPGGTPAGLYENAVGLPVTVAYN